MPIHFAPVFRNPFTDIGGVLYTAQRNDVCASFEMRAVKCYEAYGMTKGEEKCKDYDDDFRECCYGIKRMKRVQAMMAERKRQYSAGEKTKKDRYATDPKVDGLIIM